MRHIGRLAGTISGRLHYGLPHLIALVVLVLGAMPGHAASAPLSGARLPLHERLFPRQADGAPRALVLEPFAGELNLGASAGQPEIEALVKAGFQVDVYRDSAVTISVLETMADYSVVYMESHSGTCGPPLCAANDVFVLTGVKVPEDVEPYRDLFLDGSMTEGTPDTTPGIIYLAFTSQLITQHMGKFRASSIVFFNGCDLLEGPTFIGALRDRGAATIYSWNKKVYNADAEAAADFIFPKLASGETASAALGDAHAAGLGSSTADDGAALQLFGDPNNTFGNALRRATPTPTPTPSPTPTDPPAPAATSTPTPTATPAVVHRAGSKCKKGYRRVKGRCRKVKKR